MANAELRNSIYGELFEQGAHGKILPDLARGYQLAPNGMTLTIKLRPHLKFSDGTALDAAAVQYNLQRDLSPASACQCAQNFAAVRSVTPESGVNDAALDGMLARAATTLNMSSRAAQYHRISAYLNKKAYADFLYQNETFDIAAKDVVGLSAGTPGINWEDVGLSG